MIFSWKQKAMSVNKLEQFLCNATLTKARARKGRRTEFKNTFQLLCKGKNNR